MHCGGINMPYNYGKMTKKAKPMKGYGKKKKTKKKKK